MTKTQRLKMNNTESGRHAEFGSTGQYHCMAGREYDVPADLAKSWVADGIATKVKAKKAATGDND